MFHNFFFTQSLSQVLINEVGSLSALIKLHFQMKLEVERTNIYFILSNLLPAKKMLQITTPEVTTL